MLDALRQPLEDGTIEIGRARGTIRYPARIQLVAAMNPCRCGWSDDPERTCRCPHGEPERYVRRISGPLLDRLDIQVTMPRVPPAELVTEQRSESSAAVAARICTARERATSRHDGRSNAQLTGAAIVRACRLGRSERTLAAEIALRTGLTARGVHRVLRVARTIADLGQRDVVTADDILAAASLRDPSAPPQMAA